MKKCFFFHFQEKNGAIWKRKCIFAEFISRIEMGELDLNLDYGYWEVAVEKQGRVKLPASLLKSLPENERKIFWVTRGFGTHIKLWTLSGYKKQMDYMNSLDRRDPDTKLYRNLFLTNASRVECDAQNRFVIPKPFMDEYGIDNEIVLLKDNGEIELWSGKLYHQKHNMTSEEFEQLDLKIYKSYKDSQNNTKEESHESSLSHPGTASTDH